MFFLVQVYEWRDGKRFSRQEIYVSQSCKRVREMERIRLKKKNPNVRIIFVKVVVVVVAAGGRRAVVELSSARTGCNFQATGKLIDKEKGWSSSDRELDCGGCCWLIRELSLLFDGLKS